MIMIAWILDAGFWMIEIRLPTSDFLLPTCRASIFGAVFAQRQKALRFSRGALSVAVIPNSAVVCGQ
jgi:hypothetical protein